MTLLRKQFKKQYWSWKVLRQNNKDDIDSSWSDFEGFLKSIGDKPSDKHILAKVDKERPWGDTNFYWRELNKIPGQKFDMKEYSKRYRTEMHPHYDRERRYKNKYGISLAQYDEMIKTQNGCCAICGEHETYAQQGTVCQLAVDHDHDTKKVRELLDNKCNAILGHAGDSPTHLIDCVLYLAKHSDKYEDIIDEAISKLQKAKGK